MAKGFVLDDTIAFRGRFSTVCSRCQHFVEGYKCGAFTFIPEEIWMGDNKHRKPYPGDKGIQFKPKPKAEELFDEL